MSGMDLIEVMLKVPRNIAKGLAEGTVFLDGGTVRDAQGHIRRLLHAATPAREVVQKGALLSPKLLAAANSLPQTLAKFGPVGVVALVIVGGVTVGLVLNRRRKARLNQQRQLLAVPGLLDDEVLWRHS